MTSLQLTWTFDEALRPTDPRLAKSQVGRVIILNLAAATWRTVTLRRVGRVALMVLVFTYLTLAGFICAHWCEVMAQAASAAASGGLHAHHSLVLNDGPTAEAPAGGVVVAGTTVSCGVQAPSPVDALAPLLREPPVPVVGFLLTLIVIGAAAGQPSRLRP